jgi:hypothetical protein
VPDSVSAFKIARGKSGMVEVMWKPDAILSAPWHGVNGVGSPGFIVLRSRPYAPPGLLPPCRFSEVERKRATKGACSGPVQKLLRMHDKVDAVAWHKELIDNGALPMGKTLDHEESYDGQYHLFGLPGAQKRIRYKHCDFKMPLSYIIYVSFTLGYKLPAWMPSAETHSGTFPRSAWIG